jgi:tetratricopeptide (TPR) repeat protein
MGRFFNREAAVVAVGLLIAGVAVGLIAGLKPWVVVATTAGIVALLHWPVTLSFQSWVLEYYVEHGKLTRALELAIEIRDSSMIRREREKAHIDVAFVHFARGDYEHALQNLNKVVPSTLKPATKAVVEASTGYALAWLERELPRAEELVQRAITGFPQEPLFGFFLALVRYKQGRFADAKELVLKSLEAEPDPKLPHPGERSYVLALTLKALGDAEGARQALEKAKATHGRFAELAAKDLADVPAPKPEAKADAPA